MSIKYYHLVNGIELVATHVSTDANTGQYVLKNALQIAFNPAAAQNGQAQMALLPFAPYALPKSKEFRIAFEHVLFEGEPEEVIRNAHVKYTSDLVTVAAGNEQAVDKFAKDSAENHKHLKKQLIV